LDIYLAHNVEDIPTTHEISYSEKNTTTTDDGSESTIQVIHNFQKTKQLYLSLVRNARKEVLLIFPTTNAIRREEQVGIFGELRRACQRGVIVRILTPEDEFVKPQLDQLRNNEGIIVRQIESPTEAKFKLLIIDKTFSLVIEAKDDSKAAFEQAIGLATFSNSKSTVMPYVTIFESFWRETDLYEKAREADRIKEEFVNIAAHELRNPISPIIASGDFAMEDLKRLKERIGGGRERGEEGAGKIDKDTIDSLYENLCIMLRNAARLHKISEDVLQVTRIESGKFTLNLEETELKLLLKQAIKDATRHLELLGKKDITVKFYDDGLTPTNANGQYILHCDSSKITQVIYNLLHNAIKFTDGKGEIAVHVGIHKGNYVIIKVQDPGRGIDPAIKDKLFQKFSSKSDGGTGLGLYLAKNIVEGHGGRIWATNNNPLTGNGGGGGATFSFILPNDPPLDTTIASIRPIGAMEQNI
jgi:signal transduction histidine kinase